MIYEQFPGLWVDSDTRQIVQAPATLTDSLSGNVINFAGSSLANYDPGVDAFYNDYLADSGGALSPTPTPGVYGAVVPASVPGRAPVPNGPGSIYDVRPYMQTAAVGAVGGGAGKVALLTGVMSRLGPLAKWLGPRIVAWAGPLVKGTILKWGALPSWMRSIIIMIGIEKGADLLIDTGPNDSGLIQLPGTSDTSVAQVLGGGSGFGAVEIIDTWEANGVPFVKLSDGRLGARNNKGRWKLWRPKKPIVIYASGAPSIKTFIRADKALDKQAKALRKAIGRRAPVNKRGSSAREVIEVNKTNIR